MSTAVRALHSSERPRSEQGKAELKADFVQLRAKGLPYLRIAERLGVAKSTLANWNAELEAQIASARAMELEALQEEFFLLKEGRIRLLGEQLQRVRQELASRDLSSVPTDKVMELLLKYQAALKEEIVEVRPLSDAELSRLGLLHPGGGMVVGMDESRPKMNSQAIAREMETVLLRWRAGLILEERATQEIAILQAMLRAWDQAELERKLDALRATLEARTVPGRSRKRG
jgi:hypothetical protein